MRLSRADLVPVLAIIGGGAVGVLTFGPLVSWSPTGAGLASDPVVASSAAAESASRVFLQPSELCAAHSDVDVATFEDANLESRIRAALSVGAQADLTCGLISGLTRLDARYVRVESLVGIQNLTGLTDLDVRGNSVTDIAALSGLTGLSSLDLLDNSITDVSALSGLTSLTALFLGSNRITDVTLSGLTSLTTLYLPDNSIADVTLSGLTNLTTLNLSDNSITDITLSRLTNLTTLNLSDNSITDITLSRLPSLRFLDLGSNPGLTDVQFLLDTTGPRGSGEVDATGLRGRGDMVHLRNTGVSCADVAALRARGVTVISTCR